MSGQIKFVKGNPDYEEYLSQLDTLAKIQYKSQNKLDPNYNSKSKGNKETIRSKENFIEEFLSNKHKYRDEITNWLSGLDRKDFLKVMIIDVKWFIDIIKQMYNLIQKKNYNFMLSKNSKDMQFTQFKDSISKLIKNQNTNFDNYFQMKEYKETKYKYDSEDDNPGKNFLSFIRIFDLYDKNDSLTINDEFCDYLSIMHYLNYFSNNKIFSAICKVEKDDKKVYNWTYPIWYEIEAYNSIHQFMVAFIEKELCAKFLFHKYKENKGETLNLPSKLNDFFANIKKIAKFLKQEFTVDNIKDWKKFYEKVDIKKILLDLKTFSFNESEEYKNTFRSFEINFNNNNKHDYELDNNKNVLLDELEKLFSEKSEEKFINFLVFTNLDKNLNKENFHRKVYEKIQSLYSDKIAQELINEDVLNESLSIKKVKAIKKKREKNSSSTQILINENDEIKSEFEKKIKLDMDPLEIYKSQFIDSNLEKKEMNKDIIIETDQSKMDVPSINFLSQLNKIDQKSKILEQLILNKQASSTEKSTGEIISNNNGVNKPEISNLTEIKNQPNLTTEDSKELNKENIIIIEEKTKESNIEEVQVNGDGKKNQESSQTDENDETIKKKKKHRDFKKKIKNGSKDILTNLDRFTRTLSDNYKFQSPTSKFQIKKKFELDDKKQQEKNKITEKNEILEPEIKLNLLENSSRPINQSNIIPNDNALKSPLIENVSSLPEKVNSPFINKQNNASNKERYNSPFLNTQNLNRNDKLRSPLEYQYNDINKITNRVNKSPSQIEDLITNYLPQNYPNNNFYNNSSENKNKFPNKYNNNNQPPPYIDNSDPMYIMNQVRNPMGNNYMYMNSKLFPLITPNIAFNYGMSSNQYQNISGYENQSMIIFKRFNLEERSFYKKLHNDILDYSKNINEINNCLKEIKIFLILYVENKLKEFLIVKYLKIAVSIYGSFKTDLCIEISDIDLSVNFLNATLNKDVITNLITELSKQFENLLVFNKVIPLTNASVPIIKLEIDPSTLLQETNMELYEKFNKFKNSELLFNYKFDKDELTKIKLDLNFTENYTTSLAVDWARYQVILFPEIKPIIQVLKRYILNNKLNDPYKGGLSSYSLLIMIYFYLKTSKKNENMGEIIYEFFKIFGKKFDFTKYGIDVTQNNPKITLPYCYDYSLFIKDPVNPSNNVAKSSFKFEAIKLFFSNAYRVLKQYRTSYNNDGENIDNIIYDFLLNKKYN